MLRRYKLIFLMLGLLMGFSSNAHAIDPVGTDSRIRTFIYGKNDVFRVVTTFGYQTSIEFEEDEKLKTISVGNSGYFRITPLKNKIIVRGLQPNLLTNMSVVTNKRNYQFELSTIINSIDDVMYVVRFYYPESNDGGDVTPIVAGAPTVPISRGVVVPQVNLSGQQSSSGSMPMSPMAPPMMSPAPQQPPISYPSPAPAAQQPAPGMNGGFAVQSPSGFNYNYSLTGPEDISPTEVFDDSTRTYFKFAGQDTPNFRVISPGGEMPANYQFSNGYYVVEAIAPEINVYFGSDKITVYNESYPR